MSEIKKVLIVGGVAGGASCAARLRRLDETAEIILFDRGPFVSFANCGLPYYVGEVIKEEQDLLVASQEMFKKNFNIEVRTHNDVVAIDRDRREIEVRETETGRTYHERYDALVLAPGAAPLRPPLPGIDFPEVHILRTIPDSNKIREWIAEKQPKRAVVVGGGFIGLEMAENLVHRNLNVTVIEMLPQLMPPFDPEMAEPIARHLESQKVRVELGDAVAGFERQADGSLLVRTKSGHGFPADLVILSIGVRPETSLAKAAGIELGESGGIRVDETMRTSDANIWAVGDAVEVQDQITGQHCLIPLAGPANRQGRIAAGSIAGREVRFRGVQGTAVCGCLGLSVAMTGASEKRLKQAGITDYEKVYLHPGSHAGYYPGSKRINMKLLFSKSDGRVLGAQAVGEVGVDKRIDVIAMAIQKGATVYDLEEAELCYAPQYGAAKDPVNLAGMVAANVLRGDLPLADWSALDDTKALVVDVRGPDEYNSDHIDGAINIPMAELRERYQELPRDREIWVNCAIGQRSYYATRFLKQKGFNVRELSGGIITYWGYNPM
jgi:NADPH-dependent 2,4-dienoyl-CoA reductase/sulfur reductase-like enzyme/rhodanese-related sulfurtransferase